MFLKDTGGKQESAEKEVWGQTLFHENLRLHNVSIQRFFFYQNQFINKYASHRVI